MSNLSRELERRARAADSEESAATSWKPGKPHGWTPAGIVAIIAALGGPAVIVPVVNAWVNKLQADADAARAHTAHVVKEQERLSNEIRAARAACAAALDAANTAKSRAGVAETLAEQAPKR